MGIEFSGGSELGRAPERIPDRPRPWLGDRPAKVPEVTRPDRLDRRTSLDLGEGKVIRDAAKDFPARRLVVTAGHPGDKRVVVEKITLDSTPRDIFISRSCGVQAGNHNRQFNEYRYELGRATGSIDKVFDGHPLRQWAFGKLADNPGSLTASFFFRQLLPDGPVYSGGRIAFTDTGQGVERITARLDEDGAIVIDSSRGVQTGNWNTQRNNFHYDVQKPEFHLEAALRDPHLAQALAVAASNPDNPAVQHSVVHRLGNYDGASWSSGDIHLKYSGILPRPVRGDGVQAGYSDRRRDKVCINAGKVILTGWERVSEYAGNPARDRQLQAEHQNRILASQPPGVLADAAALAPEGFLSHFIEHSAVTALDQMTPGRPHLAAGMAEEIKAALGSFGEPADDHSTAKPNAVRTARLGAPGYPERMLISEPAAGYRRARESRRAQTGVPEPGLPFLGLIEFNGPRQASEPDAIAAPKPGLSPATGRAAAAGSFTPEAALGGWVRVFADGGPAGPAAAEPRAAIAPQRHPGSSRLAAGAVVYGSAAEIAAAIGSPFLDAGLLVRYVRERIWADRYNGRHQSVTRALRSIRALRVVLFLDPVMGKLVWVDVDPARQVPAAVLFMEADFSSGLPGRFRGIAA